MASFICCHVLCQASSSSVLVRQPRIPIEHSETAISSLGFYA